MYVVLGWGWRADHMAQLMAFFCASGVCGGVAVEVPSQGALYWSGWARNILSLGCGLW